MAGGAMRHQNPWGTKFGGKGGQMLQLFTADKPNVESIEKKGRKGKAGASFAGGQGGICSPTHNRRYVRASSVPQGQDGLVEAMVTKNLLVSLA